MPLNRDIKRVMVIGSGPIVIGQAAEFDYAGTQACRALREEGLEVILVNSNPPPWKPTGAPNGKSAGMAPQATVARASPRRASPLSPSSCRPPT